MRIKRSHVAAATIILVISIVWVKGFWFTEMFRTHKSNEPHRTALLQIRDAVAVGASHADVLAAYWRHRTDNRRLFADRSTGWVITMPLEFEASDWTLLIEFHDGTSDGPTPKDGPKEALATVVTPPAPHLVLQVATDASAQAIYEFVGAATG